MTETVDATGRKLIVRELDWMDEMDMIEAAGGDAWDNKEWKIRTLMACQVTQINEVPCVFPRDRDRLRAHLKLVGRDGVNAVLQLRVAEAEATTASLTAEPAEIETAKN